VSDIADRLLELRKRLDKEREGITRMEGAVSQTRVMMQKEFGCRTLKKLKAKRKELLGHIKKLETTLESATDELEAVLESVRDA